MQLMKRNTYCENDALRIPITKERLEIKSIYCLNRKEVSDDNITLRRKN